jgi:hypothetical protein
MAIYKDNVRKSSKKTVSYSMDSGTKQGSDIYWNDIPYRIPMTLQDDEYTFRIEAVDSSNGSIRAVREFIVKATGTIGGGRLICSGSSCPMNRTDSLALSV